MASIRLPNLWLPRRHQRPLWRYMENGGRHAVAVWHRRAGKDSTALNITCVKAHERIGVYWHMLPEAAQARKAVWNGIDRKGRRIIDQVFPQAIRKRTNATDMLIELKCGSIWQLVGSDNYNSLVGSNPVGIVHSEHSIANPSAREFLRPILRENGGWEMYIYTPRGKTHGWELHEMAKNNPAWFAELLTIEDTGLVGLDGIAEERAEGMSEDIIQQEYYCSFDAAVAGTYYGQLMSAAEKDGRVGRVPHDPKLRTETWWDLGINDTMSIWFVQVHQHEIRVIDYYESSGEGLAHYAKVLHEKPYVYSRHVVPHDIEVRELSTGKSRREALETLGVRPLEIVPALDVNDGIQAVRAILPRCWFDREKTDKGVKALSLYRKAWDEKNKVFRTMPLHDWASHPSDAFRMGAIAEGKRAPANFNRKINYPKSGVA